MCVVRLKLLKDPRSCMVSYEISVELQFEFEWLKRAINCSKWAISSQVGMRSLKALLLVRLEEEGSCSTEAETHVGGLLNRVMTDPDQLL